MKKLILSFILCASSVVNANDDYKEFAFEALIVNTSQIETFKGFCGRNLDHSSVKTVKVKEGVFEHSFILLKGAYGRGRKTEGCVVTIYQDYSPTAYDGDVSYRFNVSLIK